MTGTILLEMLFYPTATLFAMFLNGLIKPQKEYRTWRSDCDDKEYGIAWPVGITIKR
jgi:hypothetical protein